MCDEIQCTSRSQDKPLPSVTDGQRRAFLQGVAALPLAAILAYPELAQAAAKTTTVAQLKTASGTAFQGALALPEKLSDAPTVILIHEWWGLNDQIRSVAAELAGLGYIALAVDLYDGKVATAREEANRLRKAIDPKETTEKLVSAYQFLKAHEGSNGKVGSMGWCFGGGWSLNTALAVPLEACIIYYGNVAKTAADLAPLQSPVLGHFGEQDKFINREMVSGFEKALAEAGKTDVTLHWYDADHAFANPTGARYDEADAALSWERSMAFFDKHLR